MMEPLPKKLNRKESDLMPRVMQWFVDHCPYNVAVEVKYGENKLEPHQKAALNQVREGTFAYKIPDMGRRNPFDFMVLKSALPIVVICKDGSCDAHYFGVDTPKVFHMFEY